MWLGQLASTTSSEHVSETQSARGETASTENTMVPAELCGTVQTCCSMQPYTNSGHAQHNWVRRVSGICSAIHWEGTFPYSFRACCSQAHIYPIIAGYCLTGLGPDGITDYAIWMWAPHPLWKALKHQELEPRELEVERRTQALTLQNLQSQFRQGP